MAVMSQAVRLSMNRMALVPGMVAVVCALPLATASSYLLFVLLAPAAWITYVLRSGVDVDDEGLIVRAVFGSVRIPWARITGVLIGKRHEVSVTTVEGGAIRLPNLRTRDLARLHAGTGGRLGLPAEQAV